MLDGYVVFFFSPPSVFPKRIFFPLKKAGFCRFFGDRTGVFTAAFFFTWL